MATKARLVNLNNIPPVDDLKRALIGIVDNRFDEMVKALNLTSTDKLRKLAIIARELSKKKCFFCGKKSDPMMAKDSKKTKWEELPLCSCLAALRAGARVYVPWSGRVHIIASQVDAWYAAKARGENADLSPNTLHPETVVYSNTCSRKTCGKPFSIKAKNIASAVRKWGNHSEAHLCLSCKRDVEAKKKNGQPRIASRPTHAATPKKPQKLRRVALQVSIGERVGPFPTAEQLAANLAERRGLKEQKQQLGEEKAAG